MVQIDWVLSLAVALEAAGLIQWAKTFIKVPTWVWGVLLPPLCVGLALAPLWLHIGALGIAFAQLGYEALFKVLAGKVGIPKP
jgi:hypothetical protein